MTYVTITIGIGGEKENVRRVVSIISDAMHEAARGGEVTDVHFSGSPETVPAWVWPDPPYISDELCSWGKENLPTAIFNSLSTTREGVLAMQRMMGKCND